MPLDQNGDSCMQEMINRHKELAARVIQQHAGRRMQQF